jgi:FtsH-binding integral membrane protein
MSLFANATVWEQNARGRDEISASTFNAVLGITTLFSMAIYAFFIAINLHTVITTGFLIVSLVAAFGGLFVALADSIGVKMIGCALTAGGLGAITGPYVAHFKMASVLEIAFATVVLTAILGAIGWLWPSSLESWGTILFNWLIALIVMQIFAPMIYIAMGLPVKGVLHALDWIGVIIFSGYVIFDFNRAQEIPKTTENAIWCGLSVFLDIANLFIRLLELFGQTSSSDD